MSQTISCTNTQVLFNQNPLILPFPCVPEEYNPRIAYTQSTPNNGNFTISVRNTILAFNVVDGVYTFDTTNSNTINIVGVPTITFGNPGDPTTISFQYNDGIYSLNYSIRYVFPNNFLQGSVNGVKIIFVPPEINIPDPGLPNIKIISKLGPSEIEPRNVEVVSIEITITDYFKYELCRHCLVKTPVDTPVDSIITLYHPDFYLVIKGDDCACNLVEKINILLETTHFPTTTDKVLSYAITVYSLAGLIYGCFKLKYLTQIKYSSFLKDLRCSRFNIFYQLFVDPKYGFIGLNKLFIV